MAYHPDDEKREQWLESYSHWYTQECGSCGYSMRVNEAMNTVECSECGDVAEPEPVPVGDIPDPVIEYREREAIEAE